MIAATALAFSAILSANPSAEFERIQMLANGPGLGLDEPAHIAFASDGSQFYVTTDHTVALFEVVSGQAHLRQVLVAGGLDGAGALIPPLSASAPALSADENWFFLSGPDSLHAFSRDLESGVLRLLQTLRNGEGDGSGTVAQGLGPGFVHTSGDGHFVYASSDNALVVLEYTDGATPLRMIQVLVDGGDDGQGQTVDFGVPFLGSVRLRDFVLSDTHLYITSYSGDAVSHFRRDESNGRLSFIEVLQAGGLDSTGMTVQGLSNPRAIATDTEGRFIYVASESARGVAVFARVIDGTLTFKEFFGPALGADFDVPFISDIVLSGDDSFLYTRGNNTIVAYARAAGDGSIIPVQRLNQAVGLEGALALSFTDEVYVTDRAGDALSIFERDGSTGLLTLQRRIVDGPNSCDSIDLLDQPIALTLSPDQRHLYAVAEDSQALLVFQRHLNSRIELIEVQRQGQPDHRGVVVDGLQRPQSVLVSPDGQDVYVTGLAATVAAFRREPGSGRLEYVTLFETDQAPQGGNDLVISPDGAYLDVALFDGIARFARHADGSLAFVQRIAGDGPSAARLHRAGGVLALMTVNEIRLFSQSAGRLVPGQVIFGGPGDVALTEDAGQLFRFDGQKLYTYTQQSPSESYQLTQTLPVPPAKRYPQTKLLPVFEHPALLISDDGTTLYASAPNRDQLIRLRRDGVSGNLSLDATLIDGHPSALGREVDGLAGARGLAVTTDGTVVYAASRRDDAIFVAGVRESLKSDGFELPSHRIACQP